MSDEVFYKKGTANLLTKTGERFCVKSDNGYVGITVITLEDVTAAVKAVEKVHKVELTNIYDFICENKDDVINGVQNFVDNHFENYELAVETIFNSLPDIGTFKHLLVEVIQFVASNCC